METLILTDDEVKQLLSISEVVEAVELAFKQKGLGRVQMPAKIYLYFKKYNGDLRAMPTFLEDLDISAVKIVNVHPNNPIENDIPTVMAVIALIDPRTGAPIAIMGGKTITDMRTGAAGSIAAKYLARNDSKTIGLVGAGAQAKAQLISLLEVYEKLEEVRVWSRTEETKKNFVTETQQACRNLIQVIPVASIRKAVEGADIVVTTTPSRKPLVMNDMVSAGMHINCIGADAVGKEELDPNILKRAKVVVDDWEQASHSGEINVPLSRGIITKDDVWAEIGEIVAGLKLGRQRQDEITVFTSTGLAVQDAVTAKIAYSKALVAKVGRLIKIT
ncbi:MAG: alanine dehydrogenase [Candidatus Bathyarchaeota archaeon]|nr:MAG: alanine dehydrogenase [Candidatus Bathyarchaeota archaeon]